MSPRVFLTDFGLAKDSVTGSKFTRSGVTLRSPTYMSPEQARGEVADLTPATDIWALGCLLYELLSNRRAFEGDSPAAVIAAVRCQSDNAKFLVNRGSLKQRRGDLDGARADVERAVRVAPDHANALGALGSVLRDQRNWAQAAEALRQFLRLAPDAPQAPAVEQMLAECERRQRARH